MNFEFLSYKYEDYTMLLFIIYSVGMKVNNGTKNPNRAKTTISFQSNEAYKVRFRIYFHMFNVHFF